MYCTKISVKSLVEFATDHLKKKTILLWSEQKCYFFVFFFFFFINLNACNLIKYWHRERIILTENIKVDCRDQRRGELNESLPRVLSLLEPSKRNIYTEFIQIKSKFTYSRYCRKRHYNQIKFLFLYTILKGNSYIFFTHSIF